MIREATGMDLSKMAEIYEEYHLQNCRTRPDFYRPPPEDSYYFNHLSEMLLYGDEEIIVSEDEESGLINGFAVFEITTPESLLRCKTNSCEISMLVIRRGFGGKGIDGEIIEFIRNYAAENECVSVEYSARAESSEIEMCENNGFEPKVIKMEIKLK